MEINGKKVVDATTPLKLEIKETDCEKGKTKDPGSCAAARAIMRDYDVQSARVHVGVSYVEQKDCWLRYRTPGSLRTEIVAFDRGGEFEPGNYTLAPFNKAHTLTAMRKRAKAKKLGDTRPRHDKNKAKRTRHEVTNVRPRGANR